MQHAHFQLACIVAEILKVLVSEDIVSSLEPLHRRLMLVLAQQGLADLVKQVCKSFRGAWVK